MLFCILSQVKSFQVLLNDIEVWALPNYSCNKFQFTINQLSLSKIISFYKKIYFRNNFHCIKDIYLTFSNNSIILAGYIWECNWKFHKMIKSKTIMIWIAQLNWIQYVKVEAKRCSVLKSVCTHFNQIKTFPRSHPLHT